MVQDCVSSMRNLISLEKLEENVILELFFRAEKIKNFFYSKGRFPFSLDNSQIALVFGEPSTRTKISFQMAAQRLGAGALVFEENSNSSKKKGESAEDTFFTIESMLPQVLVVRCGENWDLANWAEKSRVPVLCAGWGQKAHPTQALLDIFTLYEKWKGSLSGRKLLFLGDLKHSRVFQSHRELAQVMGIQLGIVAPKDWQPSDMQGLQVFNSVDDALTWSDALSGLRVQKERHEMSASSSEVSLKNTCLRPRHLEKLREDQWILHPGPVNWGVELCREVQKDSRNLIRQQVENGVFIRAMVLKALIEGWK